MHIEFSLANLNLWPSFLLDYIFHPLIMIILCLLSVFVVLGNIIVVTAIWHENQLHSVTNYLIASLAAADCLVGLVVMPFSIISEVIVGSWTFGPTWCDLWHSFDVLASTASIMNLCAISLDRYLAITNPISYPTKMTPNRVALLIVSLWTCSSLISFPAILWWHAVGEGPLQQINPSLSSAIARGSNNLDNDMQPISNEQIQIYHMSTSDKMISQTNQSRLSSELNPSLGHDHQNQTEILYRCVFTDDTYYLLFSSFISFYGPLCVMLYAYYRIYKAAVQQTRFLKHGSKQVMIGRSKKRKKFQRYVLESNQTASEKYGNSETTCDGISNFENYDSQNVVLRAHRGGGGGTTSSSAVMNGNSYVKTYSDTSFRSDHRRKNLNSELERLSSEDLNDRYSTNGHGNLIDNDGQDKNKLEINRGRFSGDNSFRRAERINSTLHKRDKIRMDSQRFDLVPAQTQPISTGEPNALEGSKISVHKEKEKIAEKLEKLERSRQDVKLIQNPIAHSNGKCREIDCAPKSLLTTMINESPTIVDTSVVNHQDSDDNEAAMQPLRERSPNNNSVKSSISDPRLRYKKISERKRSDRGRQNRDERCTNRSQDGSDDLFYSECSDSSGGTYGTGSISSILLRPQCSPLEVRENDEKNHYVKRSCDKNDTHPGRYRLRRALSFDDAEQRWLNGHGYRTRLTQDEHQSSGHDNKRKLFSQTSTSAGDCSYKLISVNRHRASCGAPTITPNLVTGTKNIKALDIRSWVRIARSKSRKSFDNSLAHKGDSENQSDSPIKPPASLLPLMMMNSDTSTDSSLVMVETRKMGTIPEVKNELIDNNDSICRVEFVDNGDWLPKNKRSMSEIGRKAMKKTVSLESDYDKNKRNNKTKRNANFINNIDGAKGQLLCYESEKLIQSIVDLKAIHYIDCTNQSPNDYTQTNNELKTAESLTNPSDLSSEECRILMKSNNPGTSERRNQQTDPIPRQRSVGKKLTKLAKERKAAKTLGIVVGVFILCWLPFFVVNIIVAICGMKCIYNPNLLNSIVTWLGWLNSAMNPVIYACWSRDFRRAFRRVLCTWVEFLCVYDGSKFARKLRLKKGSNHSNVQEVNLNRTTSSTRGAPNSSVTIGRGSISKEESLRANHKPFIR